MPGGILPKGMGFCGETTRTIYENTTSAVAYVDVWVRNTGDCNVILQGDAWGEPMAGVPPWEPEMPFVQLVTVRPGKSITLFCTPSGSGEGSQCGFEWQVATAALSAEILKAPARKARKAIPKKTIPR
jgi:hypothetical protein